MMKKKFRIMLTMMLVLAMLVPGTVLADAEGTTATNHESDISPHADTLHYYELQNLDYLGGYVHLVEYLTNAWAESSEYSVGHVGTRTATLSVEVISGSFPLSTVETVAGLNLSVSESFSVTTTIPADPSRYSKLALFQTGNVYTADLYYIISYTFHDSEHYQGSGYVFEPEDLYLEVVYQD